MERVDIEISVGKRYLSAKTNENSIEYWQWNSGFIRAIEISDTSSVSTSSPSLDYNTLLLEDDQGVKSWTNIESDLSLFLVEKSLISVRYQLEDLQPALLFHEHKGNHIYSSNTRIAIYLLNLEKKDFVPKENILEYKSQGYQLLQPSVSRWQLSRDNQTTLTTQPSQLLGSRVLVHSDPLVYTACVTSANDQDGCLILTDDKVLGEHQEYARQVHIEVIQLGSDKRSTRSKRTSSIIKKSESLTSPTHTDKIVKSEPSSENVTDTPVEKASPPVAPLSVKYPNSDSKPSSPADRMPEAPLASTNGITELHPPIVSADMHVYDRSLMERQQHMPPGNHCAGNTLVNTPQQQQQQQQLLLQQQQQQQQNITIYNRPWRGLVSPANNALSPVPSQPMNIEKRISMDPYAHHIPKKVTKYSHMDSGGLPPHPSPAMQPVKETLIPMTNGYSNNDLHHHHRNITRPSNQRLSDKLNAMMPVGSPATAAISPYAAAVAQHQFTAAAQPAAHPPAHPPQTSASEIDTLLTLRHQQTNINILVAQLSFIFKSLFPQLPVPPDYQLLAMRDDIMRDYYRILPSFAGHMGFSPVQPIEQHQKSTASEQVNHHFNQSLLMASSKAPNQGTWNPKPSHHEQLAPPMKLVPKIEPTKKSQMDTNFNIYGYRSDNNKNSVIVRRPIGSITRGTPIVNAEDLSLKSSLINEKSPPATVITPNMNGLVQSAILKPTPISSNHRQPHAFNNHLIPPITPAANMNLQPSLNSMQLTNNQAQIRIPSASLNPNSLLMPATNLAGMSSYLHNPALNYASSLTPSPAHHSHTPTILQTPTPAHRPTPTHTPTPMRRPTPCHTPTPLSNRGTPSHTPTPMSSSSSFSHLNNDLVVNLSDPSSSKKHMTSNSSYLNMKTFMDETVKIAFFQEENNLKRDHTDDSDTMSATSVSPGVIKSLDSPASSSSCTGPPLVPSSTTASSTSSTTGATTASNTSTDVTAASSNTSSITTGIVTTGSTSSTTSNATTTGSTDSPITGNTSTTATTTNITSTNTTSDEKVYYPKKGKKAWLQRYSNTPTEQTPVNTEQVKIEPLEISIPTKSSSSSDTEEDKQEKKFVPNVFPKKMHECELKLEEKRLYLKKRGIAYVKSNSLTHMDTEELLKQKNIAKLENSSFLQESDCLTAAPKLLKCRECKLGQSTANIFCRFYAFRRLKYNTRGHLAIAGFSMPTDASSEDIELWMPSLPLNGPSMSIEKAKYVILCIGDRFCDLMQTEIGLLKKANIIWKHSVARIREMCDTCNTTLFNMHWVCEKCGFVVCIDCYDLKRDLIGGCPDRMCSTCKSGGEKWLTCTVARQVHDPCKLTLTQIIPSDVLIAMDQYIHEARERWNILVNCPCGHSKTPTPRIDHTKIINEIDPRKNMSKLSILAEIASHETSSDKNDTMIHYQPMYWSQPLTPRKELLECYDIATTRVEFPDIDHSWLDNGRVLRLHHSKDPKNIFLFQKQWKKAQPVLVSNCHDYMDNVLWHPQSFNKEFGKKLTSQLVSCNSSDPLKSHKMEKFWNGFERIKARVTDKNDEPLILKLKDWPATEDFAEMLPKRFNDLMQALPLPEYTHRNGVFNLASRLPEFFVKPDLGPKLYCAYGSPLNPSFGSTNLHLDISDAVNLMMYAGIPKDYYKTELDGALRAMTDAGCCDNSMKRLTESKDIPGAIWHIYDPHDSDKIRDLLNKVAKERGKQIANHHDPIHDQSWYLDDYLRTRLKDEYYVIGYTIVQYRGDAVFIPAGAAHQVRNLSSCIKAAEDFVSPELIDNCFKMTQEFRHLTNKHSNQEDKLQIKNIIYHTVKDALAVLKDQNN